MASTTHLPNLKRRRRPTSRTRRFAAVLGAAALLVLVAGCRADVVVDIEGSRDGSGSVSVEITFDEAVLDSTPDVDELIETDDLVGWHVDRRRIPTAADEQLVVSATKQFSSPAQLSDVLSEIDRPPDGSEGLFRSASLVASRDGAAVLYELVVVVGLDRPVSGLVNPATAQALEGELFGIPIPELEDLAGVPLDETVTLVVRANVPEGNGRLPATGTVTLNEGGLRELRVSGEIIDANITAAEAEADRLSQRAGGIALMSVVWWVVVVLVTTFCLAMTMRSRARRRRRRQPLPHRFR